MEVRQMATAILTHQDHVLMMKKTKSRLYNHAFWSGPGGHLESTELNEPMTACLRELREETGLTESDIEGLHLRYILFRRKGEEVRQQFVYFGAARTREIISSDEGELYWIRQDELLDLDMSHVIKHMLAHYYQYPGMQSITIGAVTVEDGDIRMQWSSLVDPQIF
jgi:8-oxo-dGTP diphosphatase